MSPKQDSPLASPTLTLLRTSGPIALAMLSTFMFQVVDTYFVGQLGAAHLAALGFSANLYLLLVSLAMGAAVGVSSLVAHALGQQDPGRARSTTSLSLLLGLGLAASISLVGVGTMTPLFSALGAQAEVLKLVPDYMTTIFIALPLLVLGLLGDAAFRATGSTSAPAVIFGVAGLLNVVLDYLLVFGIGPFPRWELFGAAVATAASWLFIAVMMLWSLAKKQLLTRRIRGAVDIARRLFTQSAPAVATQVMLPITGLVVTVLAARHGDEVVAAYAVASRVEALALVGVSAVSVAVVPFVARSRGAGDARGVTAAIAFVGKTATYWGVAAFVVLVLAAPVITSWFSTDLRVLASANLYFYCVAISYAPFGLTLVAAALFNGALLPQLAFRVLAAKTLVFGVPAAAIGSLFGAAGIFIGLSVGNFAGFAYAGYLIKRHRAALGACGLQPNLRHEYAADLQALRAMF